MNLDRYDSVWYSTHSPYFRAYSDRQGVLNQVEFKLEIGHIPNSKMLNNLKSLFISSNSWCKNTITHYKLWSENYLLQIWNLQNHIWLLGAIHFCESILETRDPNDVNYAPFRYTSNAFYGLLASVFVQLNFIIITWHKNI